MRGARHTRLRAATVESHDALDRAVGAAGYFGSRDGYGRYLAKMHAFHNAFDPRALRIDEALCRAFEVDRHAGWLEEDLAALGLALPVVSAPDSGSLDATSVVLDPKHGDTITCRSGLFGALYVLTGSSLGARLLVKWADALPLPVDRGRCYLGTLSRSTVWPRFLHAIEQDDAIDDVLMVRGAVAAFDCVRAHLQATNVREEANA